MYNLVFYVAENIAFSDFIFVMLSALAVGIAFSVYFCISRKDEGYNKSFVHTLLVAPIVISMIVMLISSDVVRAISLGGMFAILRFRTRIKSSKDATLLLCIIGLSYACGLQYYLIVLLGTIIILCVLSLLRVLKVDKPNNEYFRLRILVDESLDYTNVFDKVFDEYLSTYTLKKVKVSDFGTLMELTYIVKLKNFNDSKKLLDAIRQKNGNLNVILSDDYFKIVESEE